jgi:hypothetical protein
MASTASPRNAPAKPPCAAIAATPDDAAGGVKFIMGSSAHPATFRESVILERVRSTLELCAAVEAAQYAHVFLYAEPDRNEVALAIEAFIEAFTATTEGWDTAELPNKAPFIDLLRARLQKLELLSIYVHQASIERVIVLADGSEVVLNVAVIGFANDPMPTRTVSLPAQLRACAGISQPEA